MWLVSISMIANNILYILRNVILPWIYICILLSNKFNCLYLNCSPMIKCLYLVNKLVQIFANFDICKIISIDVD